MNHNDDPASDKHFDASLRDTWRTAIDAVPPTLAWRLRPAARQARAPSRWPLGAALATAAAIAIVVGLHSHPATLPQATSASPLVATNGNDATATLDRNPDFYAWLASPDAEQLALE